MKIYYPTQQEELPDQIGLKQFAAEVGRHTSGATRGGVMRGAAVIFPGTPIAALMADSPLGPVVRPSTSVAEISGFAVGLAQDQGQTVVFLPLGSGAYVSVPASPWFPANAGVSVKYPVGWDFTAGRLVPLTGGGPALPVLLLYLGHGSGLALDENGVVVEVEDMPTAVIGL
jgi:hypothetical protein